MIALVKVTLEYANSRFIAGESMPYELMVRDWEDWENIIQVSPNWALTVDGAVKIAGISYRFDRMSA